MPLTVTGSGVRARGHAIEGARIEIRQADHLGRYDLEGYRSRVVLIARTKTTIEPVNVKGRLA